MELNQANPPVIYVTRPPDNPDLFVFDCERCGQRHTHGALEGHREPHCLNNYPDGYVLKER